MLLLRRYARNDIREYLPDVGIFTNIFLPTLLLVLTKKNQV